MPGVALINAGPLYSRDALDIASHIPPIDLIGGAAIAAVLVLAAADAVGGRIAATIVQISIAVGLYVPVLIQFPDRLGDPFQARVAVGDLLAVAARATPRHDSSPPFFTERCSATRSRRPPRSFLQPLKSRARPPLERMTTGEAHLPNSRRARMARRTTGAWPLFWNLTVRATGQRYKGSVLGLMWTLVTPLIMVGAHWVVFKFLFGTPIPNYAPFMFVGMTAWAVFFSGIQVASSSITQNATLVTKVRFPREIVPFSTITANTLTAIAMLVIAVPLCLIVPQGSWVPVVMVPLIIVLIFGMTLGLGLLLAGLIVASTLRSTGLRARTVML